MRAVEAFDDTELVHFTDRFIGVMRARDVAKNGGAAESGAESADTGTKHRSGQKSSRQGADEEALCARHRKKGKPKKVAAIIENKDRSKQWTDPKIPFLVHPSAERNVGIGPEENDLTVRIWNAKGEHFRDERTDLAWREIDDADDLPSEERLLGIILDDLGR